jgi:Resolvase, N terminal domain
MVSTNRTTLSSKPGQVREFVEACGPAPVQAVLVMDLWAKLDQQAWEHPARAAPAWPAVPAARPPGRGPVMAKIGYARVSTRGQNDDSQVDELTAYGCDKIFTDTASGKLAARPELDRALAYLREGDVLVITRLSRAMRSLKHLLALADELRERGVGLVVLKQQIDPTTPTGRLVFHVLGAIDEFQRELIDRAEDMEDERCWGNGRFPYTGMTGSPAKIIASANGGVRILPETRVGAGRVITRDEHGGGVLAAAAWPRPRPGVTGVIAGTGFQRVIGWGDTRRHDFV